MHQHRRGEEISCVAPGMGADFGIRHGQLNGQQNQTLTELGTKSLCL